ncbi:MAG: hypothetical protein KBG15_06105 [Kofleriaceae bacterium]|nr:hypothetical protein [Kofleriaceae bacterium]
MSAALQRRVGLLIVGLSVLFSAGCGDGKTPPGDVAAPPAGMPMVTWSLVRNGVATTCAGLAPANPDIKINFFQADIDTQIKRVPCSDGSAIINGPAGTYRMVLNFAPAGDPTKSGMEYTSQEVVIPDQGLTVAADLTQADGMFTWVPANIPACTVLPTCR